MCVVSFVGDQFGERWPQQYPKTFEIPKAQTVVFPEQVDKDEFEDLKREVKLMKKMLIAAKIYDKETGQPDCEMEDKMDFLRKVAELVDVDLDEVFSDQSD